MFKIMQGSLGRAWYPLINTDTGYVGQIVYANNEGVSNIGAASGAADTSNKFVPFGVIVGTNLYTPTFDTTNKSHDITYASPASAGSSDYVGHEGVWGRGDLQAMVEVDLIGPGTCIRGDIFVDTVGTAPSVETLSGTPTTTTATSSATDEAGIDSKSTMYFRTGVAKGQYRITTDTSTTTITWDTPTTVAPESGDKIVRVNLRTCGMSQCDFDSEAMFIDAGNTVTSDYYAINVLKLDLREAGKEYCVFTFGGDHFANLRT